MIELLRKFFYQRLHVTVYGRPKHLSSFIEESLSYIRVICLPLIPAWIITLIAHNNAALESYYATAEVFSSNIEHTARWLASIPLTVGIILLIVFFNIFRNKINIEQAYAASIFFSFIILTCEGLQLGLSQGSTAHMPSFVLANFVIFMIAPLKLMHQLLLLTYSVSIPLISVVYIEYFDNEIQHELTAPMTLPFLAAVIGLSIYYQRLTNFRKSWLIELKLKRRTRQAERQGQLIESQRKAEYSRIQWLENMASFLQHELRNALVGAKTSMTLLERKLKNNDEIKYVYRTNKALYLIGELLNSATQATSIESACLREKPEHVNLVEIVRDQVENYTHIYPDYEIVLKIEQDVLIISSREERLIQLLDKLVSNAVDHCTRGTPIEVSCHQSNSSVILSVANQGIPLPEDKETIFDLFTSYRENAREKGHRGFGLYVVKLIAERFGGIVRANDRTDVTGAEFIVSFPFVERRKRVRTDDNRQEVHSE